MPQSSSASSQKTAPNASSESPPMNLDDYIASSDLVTIYVGPKRKSYPVHLNLLCAKSQYFAKAFRPGIFKEGEGQMHLPEDDPEAFGLLIRWLYSSKLKLDYICPKDDNKEHPHCVNQLASFVKAYTLADKFCLEELKNSAMDGVKTWSAKHVITPTIIPIIYQEVSHGSLLRKFVARKVALRLFENKSQALKLMEEEIRNEADFAMDLISVLLKFNVQARTYGSSSYYLNPQNHPACDYHEHKTTQKCSGGG